MASRSRAGLGVVLGWLKVGFGTREALAGWPAVRIFVVVGCATRGAREDLEELWRSTIEEYLRRIRGARIWEELWMSPQGALDEHKRKFDKKIGALKD